MKKIIKNKVYDTETAKFKGSLETESLYQKKNGEFFLYYKESYPDGMRQKIKPLTYEQAREWAYKNLFENEYNKVFGKVAENEGLVHIHISLAADKAEVIRRNAHQEGLTVSAYISKKCTN